MPQVEGAATDAAHAATERFNAGETIIGHVANSSLEHPLISIPPVFGINFSVTKHVFMLWFVADSVMLSYLFGGWIVIGTLVLWFIEDTVEN